MNLNNLKNALEQIIFELNANGKHESANFFQTRYDQIINFGDKIPFEVVESLSNVLKPKPASINPPVC